MAKQLEPPLHVQLTFNGHVHPLWHDWFLDLSNLIASGITGTVPLAKLTGGGANGSLTFTNGILTSKTDPT